MRKRAAILVTGVLACSALGTGLAKATPAPNMACLSTSASRTATCVPTPNWGDPECIHTVGNTQPAASICSPLPLDTKTPHDDLYIRS